MEIAPAKLDAIAKWMGWPEVYITKALKGRCHVGTGPLDQNNMMHAMLVLEAMGQAGFIYALKGWDMGCVCRVGPAMSLLTPEKQRERMGINIQAEADTPAAAIFQCAAQLVERMSP